MNRMTICRPTAPSVDAGNSGATDSLGYPYAQWMGPPVKALVARVDRPTVEPVYFHYLPLRSSRRAVSRLVTRHVLA